jgi:dolichol-phosphate mannosyltransferase
MKKVSIISAFLNEAASLPLFRERVAAAAAGQDYELEVVLVDDHCTDDSPKIAKEWAATDNCVSYLRLSRNCGSHAAFSAGLAHCTGDCAVLLAADLQDPPEVIPELLAEWREGYDVVWAVRQDREGESRSTKGFAAVYYWLMRQIALPEMPAKGADFLLIDRKVIDAYNGISEKHTSLLAMILWMGFRQTSIEYVKAARHTGKSKWTLGKKIKLFIDSIVSFSYAPIRMMSRLGFLMAAAGFLYAITVAVGRLTGWVAAGTGFAALMTVLLVGQGMILMMLGVLGEYLWRTFDEARGRPRYLIEEMYPPAKRRGLSLQPTQAEESSGGTAANRDRAARPESSMGVAARVDHPTTPFAKSQDVPPVPPHPT